MEKEYVLFPDSKNDTGATYVVPKYRKTEAKNNVENTKEDFESALRKNARPLNSKDEGEKLKT